MTEQRLDNADIDAIFQKMGGKAVPQGMRADAPGNLGRMRRLDHDAIELSGADRLERVLARKQPAVAVQHALAMADLPPLTQQGEQIGREHGVAILPAFTALDPDQHAFAVDIAHLEHGDLADAQPGTIGNRQRRLVLEAGGGVEQARHLVAAQHHWQIAGTAHAHQLARQIGPIEGIGEEEPQRRDHTVHGRHRNAGFTLGQLKLANILGGRGIRRPP